MPFASLTQPSLPIGLFKAQLEDTGIPCQTVDLNFDFARRIGIGGYESIALLKGIETQVGEWLFARAAWGRDFGRDPEEFLAASRRELEQIPKIPDPAAWLHQIRSEIVDDYLDDCIDRLEVGGTSDVVAFSCTFFQTISSLALARRIRQVAPMAKLVFGGACLHGPMGAEIIRSAEWIDAVSTGEADDVIVPLVEALLDERDPVGLQGILYRDGQGTVRRGPCSRPVPAAVLTRLPPPDFDAFFSEARRFGLIAEQSWREHLLIPFESSRGCWWGQKHQCTFCGLNGECMMYRFKPGDQVYEELRGLATRYTIARRFQAADNILSPTYFKNLIPRLAEAPLGIELFYEIKPNLTRRQIRALSEAGIRYVQPGIESLSTDLLDLMDKGVTALQNVFLLKCCREYGIVVNWNMLVDVPGETVSAYEAMSRWIRLIPHLTPPREGSRPIECHRFSKYHDEADQWVDTIEPQRWYAELFPPDTVDLERVAYFFDARWKETLEPETNAEFVEATDEWVAIWARSTELPRLRIRNRSDDTIDIEDTRQGRATIWHLDPFTTTVYRAVDAPTRRDRIQGAVASLGGTAETVSASLENLERAGLVLRDGDRYLAIALAEDTIDPSLDSRRLRHRPRVPEPVGTRVLRSPTGNSSGLLTSTPQSG